MLPPPLPTRHLQLRTHCRKLRAILGDDDDAHPRVTVYDRGYGRNDAEVAADAIRIGPPTRCCFRCLPVCVRVCPCVSVCVRVCVYLSVVMLVRTLNPSHTGCPRLRLHLHLLHCCSQV